MKIRKSFVINLSTYSFIVWISTIIYFIFSIKSHKNIDIWSQKDSNILLIDILIGVFSFPLAILGVVIFLSNWIKKTKINQENSNIHLKNRAFNPWLVISMFLLVILAYLYGKSENIDLLGTKTKVFPTSVLQTSVTPYPPSYTPIPNKYTNYTAPTTDSDPIIDCKSDKCGSNKVRQSECSKSTCCQLNGKWIFYKDRNQCTKDQGVSTSNMEPLIDCVFNSKIYRVTQKFCDETKAKYGVSNNSLNIVDCPLKSGIIKLNEANCNQAIYDEVYKSTYDALAPVNPTTTIDPAIEQQRVTDIQRCKDSAKSKYDYDSMILRNQYRAAGALSSSDYGLASKTLSDNYSYSVYLCERSY